MSTVWVAFRRGEFFGEADPPGPRSFVGVYASEDAALENCWPKGHPLFVEECVVQTNALPPVEGPTA